jgi:hypothetical protein
MTQTVWRLRLVTTDLPDWDSGFGPGYDQRKNIERLRKSFKDCIRSYVKGKFWLRKSDDYPEDFWYVSVYTRQDAAGIKMAFDNARLAGEA